MGVAPRSLFHESATSEPAAGCYEIQLTGEEAPKRKLEVALGQAMKVELRQELPNSSVRRLNNGSTRLSNRASSPRTEGASPRSSPPSSTAAAGLP
jgi:hypothetical protein